MMNGSHDSANFDASLTEDGRYRLLVEAIRDYAIYMLDRNGVVTNWNLGAERFKGYRASEIVGEHFSRFYTEEDKAAGLPAKVLEIAEREGKFEAEGWRVRKDGSRFWAHVVVDPIRNHAGRVVGYAKITRDLTERKEAQTALDEAREALFQSQKTEALGRLTGGVAHDFNNLLAAVIASLELLERRITDEKLLAFVSTAKQAATRGTNLAQRMLGFARRQDLDVKHVDVPALVYGLSDLLQRSIGPQTRIRCSFPIGLPAIVVDPNHLETAILNLVVNARDAIAADGEIEICARRESVENKGQGLRRGEYVCVSVSDDGEGMDEETARRATEPFFTTKGIGKGTGLGLSMVQGLAEQSGGKLAIISKEGEGTTVQIWFPVAHVQAGPVAEPATAPTPERQPVGRLRILAVDDDSLVLMSTVAMLEDLGHRVFQATSAKAALKILEQNNDLDLVLTDQAMPHMTGLELIRELAHQWPDLPTILATGYAELPEYQGQIVRLAKPYFQNDLRVALERAVATR